MADKIAARAGLVDDEKRVEYLERLVSAFNTEAGKILFSFLKERNEKVVHEFITRDLSEFNETQMIAFAYSIRGKLQVIRDFIRTIENASMELQELTKEMEARNRNLSAISDTIK